MGTYFKRTVSPLRKSVRLSTRKVSLHSTNTRERVPQSVVEGRRVKSRKALLHFCCWQHLCKNVVIKYGRPALAPLLCSQQL